MLAESSIKKAGHDADALSNVIGGRPPQERGPSSIVRIPADAPGAAPLDAATASLPPRMPVTSAGLGVVGPDNLPVWHAAPSDYPDQVRIGDPLVPVPALTILVAPCGTLTAAAS
ncbi:hypothetical protein Pen02_56770 [Plantactinospora endophytica]|uniref:Uncharacterized protein n=1 Tax=Plantactinospora endophytica TaxID=673535 RepID=A0ABQ4E7S3_9ACTN|nr:hypothetical protein Pen02_56770 [Plantactinospora endophytica]